MTGTFTLNTTALPTLVDAQAAADDQAPVDALWDSGRTVTLGAGNSKVKITTVAHGDAATVDSVAIVDPAAINQALSVTVSGSAITVHAATDGSGVITSTAAEVITAINGSGPAAALVTASAGAGSDGTGVVAPVTATHPTAAAPLVVSDSAQRAALRLVKVNGIPAWIES